VVENRQSRPKEKMKSREERLTVNPPGPGEENNADKPPSGSSSEGLKRADNLGTVRTEIELIFK
jgi:hypothetical protein